MATNFKPITIKEHVIHAILVFITGGAWLFVYLIRVYLKRREIKRMSDDSIGGLLRHGRLPAGML